MDPISENLPVIFNYTLEPGFPEEVKANVFVQATPGSAGYDLYNYSFTPAKTFLNSSTEPIESDTYSLKPGDVCKISTGVSIELPHGYTGFLFKRSSTDPFLNLANAVGVIDTDYRGIIIAKVVNTGEDAITLKRWERLFQLVILKQPVTMGRLVEKLNPSIRGIGGFGSTGTGAVK